jgi:ferredoxin-NADP reductase
MAYLDELRSLAESHPEFKLVATCTRDREGAWKGETKRIDRELMDNYIVDYDAGDFLLCGPREFMDAIIEILHSKGVEKRRIRKELFS